MPCRRRPRAMGQTRLTSTALALTLTIAACATGSADSTDPLPPIDEAALARDLAEARVRWADQKLDTYHYEAFFGYEDESITEFRCLDGRFTVQIVDGVATEARDGFSGCVVALDEPDRPPLTLEEWFDLIESFLNDDSIKIREMDASFNEHGLPTHFFVAWESGGIEAAINELGEGVRIYPTAEHVLAELAEAEAQWEATGVTSYRFRVEKRCFCPEERRGPFQVVVRSGEVVEATREGGALAEFAPTHLFTVAGLFEAVERYAYSDQIVVTYDKDLGFPLLIDADPVRTAIDEEQTIVVSDFTVLDR